MDDIGEWFDVGASDHGEVVLRYHSKWSSAILLRCGCRPSPNHKSQIFMFLYGWCSFTVQGFLMVLWMSSGGILCFSNECLWEREMVRDPQYILSVVSVAVVESKAKEMVSRLKPESWKVQGQIGQVSNCPSSQSSKQWRHQELIKYILLCVQLWLANNLNNVNQGDGGVSTEEIVTLQTRQEVRQFIKMCCHTILYSSRCLLSSPVSHPVVLESYRLFLTMWNRPDKCQS